MSQRVRAKTAQSNKYKNRQKEHTKNDAKTRLQMKPFSGVFVEVLEVKKLTFWSLLELRDLIWRPGKARQGEARRGNATRGEARPGEARTSESRRGRCRWYWHPWGSAPLVRGSLAKRGGVGRTPPLHLLCFWAPALAILICLLYTSPSPRDKRQSRMPSSA